MPTAQHKTDFELLSEFRRDKAGGTGTITAVGGKLYLKYCVVDGKKGQAHVGALNDVCFYEHAPHATEPPKPEPEAANDNPEPRIKIRQFELRGTASVPRREFVYGSHLVRKFISALFAPGGLGKTSLTTTEALAMVTGRPLLGQKPEKPLHVWFINAEDPIEEIERKFEATAAHFKITNADIGGRLFLSSGRDSDFVVATDDRKAGVKIVQPVVEEVVGYAARHSIDVMIVDPFVSTHHVNENDNAAVQAVAKLWIDIAEAVNCAIDLAHHTVKGDKEVTADSGRGASALAYKARAVRVLNRMTTAEAGKWDVPVEDIRSYFRADIDKANLVKSGGHSSWHRFVSIPMGNGQGLTKPQDHVGVVESWAPPDAEDTAAIKAEREKAQQEALVSDVMDEQLEIIKVRLWNGDYKRNPQANSWAGKLVAEILEIDISAKDNKSHVEAMLAAWIGAGELEVVDLPDHHRRQTPHVKPVAAL